MKHLTAERLRELLSYDAETGVFRWRCDRFAGQYGTIKVAYAGHIAGGLNASLGYVQIRLDYRLYYAHRLAWLHVHSEIPKATIDHINGDRTDNRIVNLRVATHSQNNANRGANKRNSSGFKGVHWHKRANKWMAEISFENTRQYLGLFDTAEEAAKAYQAASRALHKDFACSP